MLIQAVFHEQRTWLINPRELVAALQLLTKTAGRGEPGPGCNGIGY